MKRTISTVIIAFPLLLCSCNYPLEGRTPEESERILEEKYAADFTLISSEQIPACHDKEFDYLYTFSDENGVEFNIYSTYRHGVFGDSLASKEDYQIRYLRANPELTEPLFNGKWDVVHTDKDDEYLTDSMFCLYIEKYSDIENAVNFAADILGGIDSIAREDYPERTEIHSRFSSAVPVVYFAIKPGNDWMTVPVTELEFPLDGYGYGNNVQYVIEKLQEEFISKQSSLQEVTS